MSQGPERLDLLGNHVRRFAALEIEDLDGHLLVQEAVVRQEHRPETSFAELALHLDELHSDLMVEVLAYTHMELVKMAEAQKLTERVEEVLVAVYRLHMVAVHQLEALAETEQAHLFHVRVIIDIVVGFPQTEFR